MAQKHLEISLEFANYLSEIGMLNALSNALKTFQEKGLYIYLELEQKRIMKQSIFSSLCNDNAGKSTKNKKTIEELEDLAIKIADDFYGSKPKTVAEEIVEKIEEVKEEEIEIEIIPIKEEPKI